MTFDEAPQPTPDAELPMLTAAQADHLRSLAAPHAQEGHRYSLHNLARRCLRAPEEQWPALVDTHFAHLREASRGGESAGELLADAHIRLLPAESVGPDVAADLTYARVVADGLLFAYALDAPTSVRILTDGDVERTGLEEMGRAGYENLMRVPVEHDTVRVGEAATLHSLYGDSPFVASKALYLGETARRVTGEPLPEHGALVAVPTRDNLVYHPIADGTVVEALNALAQYALGAYENGEGRLSPRVYWWYRGKLTSLTVIDEERRAFSLQPPPELLAAMKGLVRLDGAGRLRSTLTERAPDLGELTRETAGLLQRLGDEPALLADAFAASLTLAHARCAVDPKAAELDTWDAWSAAVQLGTALFTGATPREFLFGEDLTVRLPAFPAEPPADARAWLDACYLALVCREWERLARLAEVPLERLREDDSVDEYVLHWIDTLRTYVTRGPMDDIVQKLIATMQAAHPEAVAYTPAGFSDQVDYQPAALFHRMIANDDAEFAKTLAEGLNKHAAYWDGSPAPRAQVSLGLLALASLARSQEFEVPENERLLPLYLLNGERIEAIPAP
ncbi:immunity 49 family protein [Streptomyces roseirectus]|uniref:Immunity 49 family protein n=1 Tax=Streptomyces roseirectus TaxID=2768066 RepID=A0A7H0ICR6_9ACTN|nr:immunity 49 family protein [Streptomyces roseirectus]QNP70582.1 immunity 49 family protein [Streptomyces roseirectus]